MGLRDADVGHDLLRRMCLMLYECIGVWQPFRGLGMGNARAAPDTVVADCRAKSWA